MSKKVGCFTITQSEILADDTPILRRNAPWYIRKLQDTIIFVNKTMAQGNGGIEEILWSNYDAVVYVSHSSAGHAMYHRLEHPKEFLQFLLPDVVRFSVSKSQSYNYLSKLHELEEHPPLYYR